MNINILIIIHNYHFNKDLLSLACVGTSFDLCIVDSPYDKRLAFLAIDFFKVFFFVVGTFDYDVLRMELLDFTVSSFFLLYLLGETITDSLLETTKLLLLSVCLVAFFFWFMS